MKIEDMTSGFVTPHVLKSNCKMKLKFESSSKPSVEDSERSMRYLNRVIKELENNEKVSSN